MEVSCSKASGDVAKFESAENNRAASFRIGAKRDRR